MNQPIRVLLVDDQQSARKGLKAVLAFYPEILIVGEAVNGQEAVQLVAEQRPNVVVMDLQMPVMDGVAATRLIKTRWPAIKVIVLTVQAARRGEAFAAGADTFLLKGNGPEALQQAILGETEATFSSDFNRCSKAVVPAIAPNASIKPARGPVS
jgi:DNA-binding NarL/FixJ family response regulator